MFLYQLLDILTIFYSYMWVNFMERDI
jgi:hypothetical protein